MKQRTLALHDDSSTKSLKSGKRELIIEGRGKNFYQSDKPDLIILEFKHKGATNGEKETKELSALRSKISSYLFKYLDGFHIPTHFVNKISDTELLVKRLETIPLFVRVYNLASGTLVKRFGLKDGTGLNFPVVEHYQKNGEGGSAWVNEYHIYAFGIATPEEFKQINRIASKVNAVLRGLCDRRQLMLADLQLEFGRYKGQVVLGDELSPLTCRFWDSSPDQKNAKIRSLQEQGDLLQLFTALSDRLELKV